MRASYIQCKCLFGQFGRAVVSFRWMELSLLVGLNQCNLEVRFVWAKPEYVCSSHNYALLWRIISVGVKWRAWVFVKVAASVDDDRRARRWSDRSSACKQDNRLTGPKPCPAKMSPSTGVVWGMPCWPGEKCGSVSGRIGCEQTRWLKANV